MPTYDRERDQAAEITTLRAKLKAAEEVLETITDWDAIFCALPDRIASQSVAALTTIRSKP